MKKNILKLIVLVLVLSLSLLTLTACGTKEDDMNNKTTTSTMEPTKTITESNPTEEGKPRMTGEGRGYGSYNVYYANKDRTGLLKEEMQYTKDYAKDLSGKVRESLNSLFTKNENDYKPLASNDKNIKSISLDPKGVLIVDFDKEFFDTASKMDIPDNATVYGLVNTLAQYSEIKAVKFTVDGQPLTWNDVTYSDPFTEDLKIVVK